MGNTPSSNEMTKDELLEYQKKLIDQQQEEINRLNTQNIQTTENKKIKIDPYKILEIGKNYDESSLKKAYLKKALVTHPDRGGTEDKFKLVTMCYKALLKKLLEERNNNDHNDLRKNSNDFFEKQSTEDMQNFQINLPNEQNLTKNFNSNTFNKIYEENRIENIYDEGYGEWMKQNHISDNEPQDMFNGNFNSDVFHDKFKQTKKNKNIGKQMIRYDEPQTSISFKNKDSLMVLGRDKIDDFSGESGGLAYRDYKDAFENPYLIDESDVNIDVKPRTIKSVENERSNISYQMSSEDIERLSLKQKREEIEEKQRLQRLQQEEMMATDVYNRLHQRMIGS